MPSTSAADVYSPREIARAAGIAEQEVTAALGGAGAERFVSHAEAVRVGRALVASRGSAARPLVPSGTPPAADGEPMFSMFGPGTTPASSKSVPLAFSGTLHAGVIAAAVFLTTFGLAPEATTLNVEESPLRFVFISSPGPGGGGGGGGLLQKRPPPKAERAGRRGVSSPVPPPPRPIAPSETPPEPRLAPLSSEALPVVVAPIIQAPADGRDRIGALQESATEDASHGPGRDSGIGAGAGTGIGPGDGSGIGPGSGGGMGGGPYRPGAGIEAPRLLREVKPDYTEDARRRGVEGEVVMEIVVRRDGSVGDVRILRRLGGGLDERAAQAVRQWRFAPALRYGTPVDLLVEVGVEFRLR